MVARSAVFTVLIACNVLIAAAQDRTVGVLQSDPRVSDGYALFCPLGTKTTYLIDMEGRVVHSWTDETNAGQMAYLHENGYMYRVAQTATPTLFNGGNGGAGQVECLTWDGDMLWSFEYRSDEVCLHHDVCPMPNGNVLLIAWERITHAEAVAMGKDTAGFNTDIWPDKIVEIAPDGNGSATVVWEWRAWDHLIQDRDPSLPNYGVVAEHPERIDINAPIRVGGWILPEDWLHSNGVKYNEALDQIVLSVRHADEIWIIDHSTTMEEAAGNTGGNSGRGGSLLYRWGNPMMYGRGTEDDRMLWGQHDPEWIPVGYPGEGNILLFNNGEFLPEYNRAFSTIDEIAPPLLPDGSYALEDGKPYAPAAPAWTYRASPKETMFGRYVSGTNRMPNGNTFICNGMTGEFFEVTPLGEVVWHYVNPVTADGPLAQFDTAKGNMVFKMRKYPADHPALAGRDLTPGGTIESYPNAIGDTPPQSGSFGIASAYPNPFYTLAYISVEHPMGGYMRLTVRDVTGREVAKLAEGLPAHRTQTYTWNGRDAAGRALPPGVYLLSMQSAAGTQVRRLVKF